MTKEAKDLIVKIFDEWNGHYPDLDRIELLIEQVYEQGYVDALENKG
jgi:hypothetical protein